MTTTIDDVIKQQFNKVTQLKAEVEVTEKAAKRGWKTNCSFVHPSIATGPVNLTIAQEADVFRAMVELLNYRTGAEKACEILELPATDEVKYQGFLISDWVDDMKKRVAMCQLKSRKDKLAQLESRLAAIISPEQKRQMELEAIMNELGDK